MFVYESILFNILLTPITMQVALFLRNSVQSFNEVNFLENNLIKPTVLLYYEDAYLTECTANTVSCKPCRYNSLDAYDLILDRTVFFPNEGGQESDSGIIISDSQIESEVLHVTIKNDIIHHIVKIPLPEGISCKLKINMEERFDKMQQHSGEHLISGYISKRFGYNNVGFHLGDFVTTLDFDGTFSDEEITEIEKYANSAVFSNVESHIFFPAEAELKTIDYRSKKELNGKVRIVEFPGYDICACCAPHVKRTGEIGLIKIILAEHFKGGTRITIKCGFRALTDYNSLQTSNRSISRLLSVKPDEIYPAVSKLSEDFSQARQRIYAREDQIALTACELHGNEPNPVLTFTDFNADIAREAVNRLIHSTDGYCSCFLSSSDSENETLRFIIASSSKDCKPLLNILKNEYGAKGGGSSAMIQGTVLSSVLTDLSSIYSRL